METIKVLPSLSCENNMSSSSSPDRPPYTPSVSNYKTSQEFWRVKTISSLTKIIERNIKIKDIKLMYYKNITNKKSNGT